MKTGNDQLPLVGVDTGGTFTDLVLVHGPVVRTWKLPSTPADPSQAVLEGLRQLCGASPALVFHGSTVATNALLEGKGADVALVTTAGFRDLLELGRQNRPNLYQLQPRKRPSLVPNNKVIEVKERCLPDGQVECPLTEEELKRVVEDVLDTGCSAVAICLLHAYANPNHEAALAAALSSAGVNVSASHRVLNEFREFERASTTVINAKVSPVMDGYLKRLAIGLSGRPLRIMQSNGGAISPSVAGQEAVRTILSGPAGGLVGAFGAAHRAGLTKVITFDMGGTSTDVALCDGGLTRTTETEIAGWPLKIPMLDIHTVGAGGGSIARIDAAGALRVGPESAGAEPGPVCYGRGGHAVTVTDANLYLGRLLPERFLGGRMALNLKASHHAIEALADQARLDPFRLAEGVLEVAEETMAGALRVVSVQRGHDPREYTLLPFGGAGGLHACALAEKLGIGRILLPAHPGLLSAVGMVLADVIRDYAHSVLWPGDTKRKMIDKAYRPMESNAVQDMAAEGVKLNTVRLERSIDLRYQGQSFEVTVPYTKDFADRFHERHEVLFGYQDLKRPLEIVTLRLRAVAPGPSDDVAMHVEMQPKDVQVMTQPVVFAGEKVECPVYERMHIPLGEYLVGPAVIIEDTATHLIKPGWRLRVDSEHNLALETMTGTEAGASTREPKPFD